VEEGALHHLESGKSFASFRKWKEHEGNDDSDR
jgi:hypothetical protein